jgi:hypothetical protein
MDLKRLSPTPSQSAPQAYDSLWYLQYLLKFSPFLCGGSKPTYAVSFTPRPNKTCDISKRCLEMIVKVGLRHFLVTSILIPNVQTPAYLNKFSWKWLCSTFYIWTHCRKMQNTFVSFILQMLCSYALFLILCKLLLQLLCAKSQSRCTNYHNIRIFLKSNFNFFITKIISLLQCILILSVK